MCGPEAAMSSRRLEVNGQTGPMSKGKAWAGARAGTVVGAAAI